MSALRREPEPLPERPQLTAVSASPALSVFDGTPARGILLGVVVSVAAVWIPLIVLASKLA